MAAMLTDSSTWIALLQICVINVLLSGDNAVVIALACRRLPPRQQRQAFIVGAAGIVVLMTALTAAAAYLLSLRYVELAGALLLLWIGVRLLAPEDGAGEVEAGSGFWAAVRTIIIADIVMSLDNVLGMAAAAHGHLPMLFVGLVITIPLILFGSALIMRLMERFPIFITLGAGLLGWVAGEMAVADPGIRTIVASRAHEAGALAPLLGALAVVAVGTLLARRRAAASERVTPGRETGDTPQGSGT